VNIQIHVFLTLAKLKMSDPLHDPAGLSPLDWRFGGPQGLSGRYGKVQILVLIGTPTSRSSSPKPVSMTTALPRPMCKLHGEKCSQ
jgi:hypothetical protein